MIAPTWPELIVLMGFGDGTEDSIAGEVHVRDVVEYWDGADESVGTLIEHERLGRALVSEGRSRIFRRGALTRRESLGGRPLAITGGDTQWIWLDGSDIPTAYDRGEASWGFDAHSLVFRQPPSRWEGDDFTHLTGPIEATAFLGRPAWAFELAPPRRKPYPLQMVVDAETGLTLREGNADFGSFSEWTSLQVGAELPDVLFVWDGPTVSPVDHVVEHERDTARRQAWPASRGLGELRVTGDLTLMPHAWDDDSGSFDASFEVQLNGSLLRRPRSDGRWDELDETGWPHHYRWADERWDWFLGCTSPLTDEQLAELHARLAQST